MTDDGLRGMRPANRVRPRSSGPDSIPILERDDWPAAAEGALTVRSGIARRGRPGVLILP